MPRKRGSCSRGSKPFPLALAGEDRLSYELLKRRLGFDVAAPRDHWLGFAVTPYASPLGPVHQAFRALPLRTAVETDG